MKLQPLDIKRQTFAKAFRGYEPAEVDSFLKQVADQQTALLDELRQAQDRVSDAERRLTHYERVEMALQDALETARDTGRRAEADAERHTRAMVERAEARAEEIIRDAERERYALRQDVMKLSTRQTEVAARLRGFLLSELEVLAQFQGDDPVGFLKLQPAGTPHALPPPPTPLLTAEVTPDDAGEAASDSPAVETPPSTTPPVVSENAPEGAVPPEAADASEPTESSPAERRADDPAEATEVAARWDTPVEPQPGPTGGGPPTGPPPTEPVPAPEPPPAAEPDATPPGVADAPPVDSPAGSPGWQRLGWAGAGPAVPEAPPAPPTSPMPDPSAMPQPPAMPPSAASTGPGGWNLRSLVTGADDASRQSGDANVAGSEAERERIRRILDDLD